jgi:hypothetical protein
MSLENIKIRYAYKHKETGDIVFGKHTLLDIEGWSEIFRAYSSEGSRYEIIGRDIYIGKDDKNWTEIYAGDFVILKNKPNQVNADHMQGIGMISYMTECLWFGAKRNKYGYYDLEWGGTESIEILANRYENPDFITDL